MISDELLKVVKLCDRRNEWSEEEWIRTLANCIAKKQYNLKVKNKEIIAFATWLFLKDLNKRNGQYVEDENGKIAYIQCTYVKSGHNGLLKKMLVEGINRYKEITHIFFCDDKSNNRKFLMPVKKWRKENAKKSL